MGNSYDKNRQTMMYLKNEFTFKRTLLTDAKKNYAAIQTVQEGNLVPDKNMNDLSPLEFKICIIEYLNKTNLKSSIAQPCKSMMLNGPSKSLNYLKDKINKSKM